MKSRLAGCFLASLICMPLSAAPSEAPPDEALIALEQKSWEAWKNRDGKFYESFLSDDHVEVGAGGVDDKAAIVAFVGSPVCVVKSWATSNFKVIAFDERTVLLTYFAEQNTTCHGRPVPSPAWVSSLYVKRNGRWLNAMYQQTPAPLKTN